MNKKELPWRTNNAELNCPGISDLVGASYIVQKDREPLLFLAILHYKHGSLSGLPKPEMIYLIWQFH